MRTKSFLFSMLAVAGMLFVSSCAQDEPLEGAADANYVDATFTLTTEDAAGTRATVGNGRKADKVVCGVFDKYGVEMDLRQTIDVEGKTATYKTRLAKGQDYRVVFFAYNEAAAAYNVTDLKDIKVVGSQKSNIEERDAFTAYIDIKADETLNSVTKRVELRRPFAQLNLGINQAEYDAAKAAGIVVANTEIKVSNVYSNFSAYDNAVAAGAQEGELTFAMNAIPAEKLEVDVNRDGVIDENTEKFHYLALNYLLVGNTNEDDKKLTNVEFRWENKSDATATDYKTNDPVTEFINIPVQRNYRTNIIGSLLTSPATFNIVIDSTFNGEYNNDDMLDKALAEGGEFKLFADMTIDESMTIEAGKNVVIDLGGNTLTVASENVVKGNLTIENGNVVIDVDGSSEVNVAFAAYNGATVNLSNANVEVAEKNVAVLIPSSNVEAVINFNKTTMTVANGSHGVIANQGAKDLKINFTESSLTGPLALYLMLTNSTVTIDEKSTVDEFFVSGGNVDVVYTGKKPNVILDTTAANVNFYNKGEYALKEELENGGEVTLTSDVTLTQPLAIPAGTEVTLNLNGKTISLESAKDSGATINNEGKLTLVGGTVENTAVNGDAAINNTGELVLKGVTVNGSAIGTTGYPAYAVVNSGKLVVEEGTTITSDRGVVYMSNGADVTINGGNFTVTDALGTRVLTSHVIYAYGSNSKLTINGGNFAQDYEAAGNTGASVICPAGATIDVYAGNFSYAGTVGQSGIFQNYMGYGAPVNVYGGTYNDKTVEKNLASGYKAVEKDGKWVVVPASVNAVVSSSSELSSAIAAGNADVVLTGDVTYNTKINNDATINLNGNTFEAAGTIELGNNADLTMVGGSYEVNGTYGHIDVRPTTTEGSVLVYEDVDFSFNKLGPTYGPSTNRLGTVVEVCATVAGANTKVQFKNCTFDNAQVLFEGMSGKTGTFEAEFIGCTFNALTSSAPIYVQNYVEGTITLTGCTFNLECTSSTASAVSVSPSSSTSVTVNATDNTFNAVAATPYTYDASKGETEVHNVKVNGTPQSIKFISSYSNATVNESGTTKTGIAAL